MKATKRINVEVLRKNLLPKIDAVQYDTGLQIILIVRDFTIPDGTTARAFFKKPSGKFVYQDCTISGNEITIDVHNQALTEYGDVCYQVRLTNGSDIVTTFKGIIEVEKSLADSSATSSETVVPAFDAAVQDAVAEIEDARDNAITYIGNGLDSTLTVEGKAADAAASGKAIDELKGDLDIYHSNIMDFTKTGNNEFDVKNILKFTLGRLQEKSETEVRIEESTSQAITDYITGLSTDKSYKIYTTDSNLVFKVFQFTDTNLTDYVRLASSETWMTTLLFTPSYANLRFAIATKDDSELKIVEALNSFYLIENTTNNVIHDLWAIVNVEKIVQNCIWENKSFYEDGCVFINNPNRIAFTTPIEAKRELAVSPKKGYMYGLQIFSDSVISQETLISNSQSWQSGINIIPKGTYFTICVRNEANTEVTTSECDCLLIENSYEYKCSNIIVPNECYWGNKINLKPMYKKTHIGTVDKSTMFPVSNEIDWSIQSMAYYNGYLFILGRYGSISILKMSDMSCAGDYVLPVGSHNDVHGSNVCFSKTIPDGYDFPYMYVSETTGSKSCLVYKVDLTGAELVQEITFDGTWGENKENGYRDFLVDENENLFIIGYNDYGDRKIIIKRMDNLPSPTIKNVVLNDTNVIDSFEYSGIQIIQGCVVRNNHLYMGNNSGKYPTGIAVFNLATHTIESYINTSDVTIEPEGIDIWNGKMYCLNADKRLWEYSFN